MRKVICFLILLFVPLNVLAISASSYIAYDLDNDIIYYKHNENDKRLIASITKIMTAIVAIENSDIEKEVVVGDEVLKAYGSAIYVEVGEKISIKDLLYGLMLRSGNDAAVVIAKNVGGSIDNFVALMNKKASEIGMNNTLFLNPHGLENDDGSGNMSTAKDMAELTRYAIKNKDFRNIFGTKKYSVKTNYKTYGWINKNKLLLSEDYITGGKTGYTKRARRTLVSTGSRNNINVVVVTLNDGNDFLDHKNMYEEIFRKYEAIKVIDKDNLNIKDEKVYEKDKLYIKDDIYVSVRDKNKDVIDVKYELYEDSKYKSGDVVGKVIVSLNNKKIREEQIYVKKNEEKLSWWKLFLRWIKW